MSYAARHMMLRPLLMEGTVLQVRAYFQRALLYIPYG